MTCLPLSIYLYQLEMISAMPHGSDNNLQDLDSLLVSIESKGLLNFAMFP